MSLFGVLLKHSSLFSCRLQILGLQRITLLSVWRKRRLLLHQSENCNQTIILPTLSLSLSLSLSFSSLSLYLSSFPWRLSNHSPIQEKVRCSPKGFVRKGNERKRERERERGGGGGGGRGHERRARKRTGWNTCVFDSMWTFQPVRFRARLSWPRPPPPPPPLSLSLSLSFSHSLFWRSLLANNELFLVLTNHSPLIIDPDKLWSGIVWLVFCQTSEKSLVLDLLGMKKVIPLQ